MDSIVYELIKYQNAMKHLPSPLQSGHTEELCTGLLNPVVWVMKDGRKALI